MKTALAIRHVAFEDLGTFAPVLADAGYAVDVVEAADGIGRIAAAGDAEGYREALAPDLVIVLGGPIGAYEEQAYPFIRDELHLIERRLAAERPVVGICLGAQLMARALGAAVYPGSAKEIGWAPVNLSAAGENSCLRHLAANLPVLHWHGDTFDLPAGATRLASNALYANQAFSRGGHALALQFHLEATYPSLERWFVGHAGEIAATAGIDVEGLRAASQAHGPAVASAGSKIFAEWLAGLDV